LAGGKGGPVSTEELLANYLERLRQPHLTQKEFDETVRRIKILQGLIPK
jgi:hypothetical protein